MKLNKQDFYFWTGFSILSILITDQLLKIEIENLSFWIKLSLLIFLLFAFLIISIQLTKSNKLMKTQKKKLEQIYHQNITRKNNEIRNLRKDNELLIRTALKYAKNK